MAHWTLEDIPWDRFDRSKVDPEMVKVAKAACMVEHHSADYGTYLCNVFPDDSEFCAAANTWAAEEIQHGKVLRRYAELADPSFDFEATFERFVEGHKIDVTAEASIRGSRCGELVARCVVEVGTSAYYSALHDAAEEPVFREICKRIAADEFRHYKLFYSNMKRYQRIEKVGMLARLKVAAGRLFESADDELAYAYHCGSGESRPYDRRRATGTYAAHTLPLYRYEHVERGFGMTLKAVGIKPQGVVGKLLTRLAWAAFRRYATSMHRKYAHA
ncbi:MAG: acyl-ACP desaturase [Alphaproteobacteria bacterium]